MDEAIRLEKLSFSYPDGQQALDEVNLVISRGESMGIVGPNGAGKSTLMLHLNGILRASDGVVSILGRSLDDRNLKWIRSRVGLVFQDPDDQLFSPTVFDDVAFGPINMGHAGPEVRQAVAKALDRVGMKGVEERPCHHLSFGEKKRVALATVLAMDPEVLVLDEPTSNLDPAGKWALINLLRTLQVTRVVVSHDIETIRALCHRVIILDRGKIVADGAVETILADRSLLSSHSLLPVNSCSRIHRPSE